MIETRALLPFFAAVWFFLAAGYFAYKLRQHRRALGRLYPIGLYLSGIGVFFVIQGIDGVTPYSCSTFDCSNLTAGVTVMLASAFIARFPLSERWPALENAVFAAMVVVSIASQVALAFLAPGLQLVLAHVFAFVVAGLFTIGFVLYQAFREDSTTGKGLGLSMSSCCVVAHGLAALPLVLTVSVPLIGVPLGIPMLFAILAPVSLIAVLVFFARIEPSASGTSDNALDA